MCIFVYRSHRCLTQISLPLLLSSCRRLLLIRFHPRMPLSNRNAKRQQTRPTVSMAFLCVDVAKPNVLVSRGEVCLSSHLFALLYFVIVVIVDCLVPVAAAAASADKVDDDHKAANTGTKSGKFYRCGLTW